MGRLDGGRIAMGHTAAVYSVQVRKKGRGHAADYRPFGDINEKGANLAVALHGYTNGLSSENDDATKVVSCETATIDGDDLLITLKHGQRGIAADVVDPQGHLRIRQTPADTQLVHCGALFRLPQAATMGWLCVHINSGRGAKKLLLDGLIDPFRQDFPDLILEVEACQLGSALRQAVENDRVDKVKLVRLEKATDRANASISKWVRGNADARLELDISSTSRGIRLLPNLIRRYLGGDGQVFGDIVIFEGITFDQAKIEVELPNGSHRTFNLERPEAGHPITRELTGLTLQNGDPTDSSLFAALRETVDDVTG